MDQTPLSSATWCQKFKGINFLEDILFSSGILMKF